MGNAIAITRRKRNSRLGNQTSNQSIPGSGTGTLREIANSSFTSDPCQVTAGLVHGPESELIQERAQVLAGKWMKLEIAKQDEFLRKILRRVVVSSTAVAIEVEKSNLFAPLLGRAPGSPSHSGAVMKLTGKFQVQRRAGALQILSPDQVQVRDSSVVARL